MVELYPQSLSRCRAISVSNGRCEPNQAIPNLSCSIRAADLLGRNGHRVRLAGWVDRELNKISLAGLFVIRYEIRRRIVLSSRPHVAMKLINRFDVSITFQGGKGYSFAAFARAIINQRHPRSQSINQNWIGANIQTMMIHLIDVHG